jgi:hypothetical protein
MDAIFKDVLSDHLGEDKCLNNELKSKKKQDAQRWVMNCQTVAKSFHQRSMFAL